jgi:hypothetical protein
MKRKKYQISLRPFKRNIFLTAETRGVRKVQCGAHNLYSSKIQAILDYPGAD